MKIRLLPLAVCCLLVALAPPLRARDVSPPAPQPPPSWLADSPAAGDFILLAKGGQPATICVADTENPAVKRAAYDLADDVERVTGAKPRIVAAPAAEKGPVILIGSLDAKNAALEQLAAAGKMDISKIRDQWESHAVQTITDDAGRPMLVIAGSDRRGTIYGIYTLSETIGVSPWYWWADVPVKKHDALAIHAGTYKQAPPAVKYRGIFLNDEDWGLRPWAAQGLDKDTGNIGPHTYAKIFELLLRLKANHLWPAMHPGTRAFNSYPENAALADAYGIVMGSSHAEPMLRNNVDEWKEPERGAFNFVTNAKGVMDYWEERVKSNAKFESIYTMGIRGIHDSGMEGGGTPPEKAARMLEVVGKQRELLSQYINPDPALVPQTLCPYKEVLALYRLDPNYPKDITLVWPDDNFGYVRHFSDEAERARSGGAGVYYHISYWGAPRDYLWLDTTSPALIWEEMTKAYAYGARNVWVVNVGDLKPAELGMEHFLRLAWDPSVVKNVSWNPCQIEPMDMVSPLGLANYRDFGPEYASAITEILNTYYGLCLQRKPEHMLAEPGKPIFSPTEKADEYFISDEASDRLDWWQSLMKRADALAEEMPLEQQAAYYQLVLYPVRGAALMNEKWISLTRYYLYAKQGRASAAKQLEIARRAQADIQRETAYYNEHLSGGKWRGIMSANPRRQPVFDLPQITPPPVPEKATLNVVPEGSETPLLASETAPVGALPQFDLILPTRGTHFIDVFNGGSLPLDWQVTSNVNWLNFDKVKHGEDWRVLVSLAEGKTPQGDDVRGEITFTAAGQSVRVLVSAFSHDHMPEPYLSCYHDNSGKFRFRVSHSEAETSSSEHREARWCMIEGLGVTLYPFTASLFSRGGPLDWSDIPKIEYPIWLRTPGALKVTVHALPTWPIVAGKPARYAVSFDDEPPQIVELPLYKEEKDPRWQVDVLRNSTLTESKHHVGGAGQHSFKLWAVDPGVVVQSLEIECLDWKSPLAAPATVSVAPATTP